MRPKRKSLYSHSLLNITINQEQNDFEALVLDITDEAKLKVQTEKNEILFLESGEISTKII